MPSKKITVDIGGVPLTLSNLDKVFYPATGFTKGQVFDYYIRIAPALLPHLVNRPLTMKRYPDGATAKFFYQKQCPVHRPQWLKTIPVWSRHNVDHINYCLMDDLPSLVWAVNLAALELHPSLSLGQNILNPTTLVFDLDPGPPATSIECCQVALLIKTIVDAHGLQSFPKTSGSKGIQVYIPLHTPVSYDQTKSYARSVAQHLEKEHPHLVVSKMTKKLRTGKVFVDWSQNDEHKTTVSVYSLRAKEKPTVSTPLTWAEVESVFHQRNPLLTEFECGQVLKRIEKHGDLFAPVLTQTQQIPNDLHEKKTAKKAVKKRSYAISDSALYTPERLSASETDYL